MQWAWHVSAQPSDNVAKPPATALPHFCAVPELQYRTSEKQKPSPVELLYSFRAAMGIKKAGNPRMSADEALAAATTEYNRSAPVRAWKVLGESKRAIENLHRCPPEFVDAVNAHHMKYRHGVSGVPLL